MTEALRAASGGLTRRWPTALALVYIVLCLVLILRFDLGRWFGPGVATMACIYLVAYALDWPIAAWIAFPLTAIPSAVFAVLDLDVEIGMVAVLVGLWLWATLAGRYRDGRWYAVQAAGMAVFGLLTVGISLAEPRWAVLLTGVGWFLHGLWDAYHFMRNKVVNRPWSEFCAVIDIAVGPTLVIVALIM